MAPAPFRVDKELLEKVNSTWSEFKERKKTPWVPGTYYVKGSEIGFPPNPAAEAESQDPEHCSRFWFNTQATLDDHDISQLTSIQLITYSRNRNLGNDKEAGSGTWFEIAICGLDGKTIKELPNGQSLSWLSHSNWYTTSNNADNNNNNNNNNNNYNKSEWCRGRMFTKDDGIFKYLKKGDVISVRISAAPKHENHADLGYLVFGFGHGPETYQTPRLWSTTDGAPLISVYAQERKECLMIPADDFSTEAKANIVDGGVDLMSRLLETNDHDWTVKRHPLDSLVQSNQRGHPVPPNFDSAIELAKGKKDATSPLRVTKHSTIKRPRQDAANKHARETPKIVVWDDSEVKKSKVQDPDAEVLIYQMHAPLWSGTLWEKALANAKEKALADAQQKHLSTIVVIDADDLRADGIRISRGISWEKTMEDFEEKIPKIQGKMVEGIREEEEKKDKLVTIRKHVHLLVRCGYEGVLHVRPDQGVQDRFVFHMVPNMAEGDLLRPYNGRMSGIHLAFVTGLAASFARQPKTLPHQMGRTQIGLAIELAIVWSHRFATTGFCKDVSGSLNYPKARDINNYKTPKTNIIYGDETMIEKERGWSLFSLLQDEQEYVAAEVVKLGTEHLEASIPTSKFGFVQTADRTEIEGYRSTAAVVHEYLKGNAKKPLSIAVFGQPGAGKSFGVKEVIKAVLDKPKDWEPIEANLSQFLDYSDLVAVFHKIRDVRLKGETPVVLFDEFDSTFIEPLGWLKYFLAPMQDGEFLDSGSIRPLGRAIFIFIGGTSHTFRGFKYGKKVIAADEKVDEKDALEEKARNEQLHDQSKIHDAVTERKAAEEVARGEVAKHKPSDNDKKAKKPDFISRLSAHINVMGPNQSVTRDKMYTMRRAMLLQGQLRKHFKAELKDIHVDKTVLNALLKHAEFPNGTRSIELILQTSRLSGGCKFESSDLASDEQLSMHVGDVAAFHTLVDSPITLAPVRPVDIGLYNKRMWVRMAKDMN